MFLQLPSQVYLTQIIVKKKWSDDSNIKKIRRCWYECFNERRSERLSSLKGKYHVFWGIFYWLNMIA